MLRKTLVALTMVSSLTVAGAANAMCVSSTQSCTGTLARVLINDGGDLFLSFDGLDVRDTGCTAASNFMVVRAENTQFKNYYAMALTAFAGGSDIFIRSQNASPTCEVRNMFLAG